MEVYAHGSRRSGSAPELLNVSTRGHVGSGADVLSGGVILGGDATANVIVRAIGPELSEAGVSAPLQDPTLELRNAEGNLLVANDDWRTDQEQKLIGT